MLDHELIQDATPIIDAMRPLDRADRVRVLVSLLSVELGREQDIGKLSADTDGACDFILSHAARVRASA